MGALALCEVQNMNNQKKNEAKPLISSTSNFLGLINQGCSGKEGLQEEQNHEILEAEDEDDYSSLSTWELDELDELIELHEQGLDVPKDRLRDLEIFDKWQNNEDIQEDEFGDLERFKRNRKMERTYGRELICLIESREEGKKIDFDRLIAL